MNVLLETKTGTIVKLTSDELRRLKVLLSEPETRREKPAKPEKEQRWIDRYNDVSAQLGCDM